MTKDSASGVWSVWVPTASIGHEYKFWMRQSTGTTAYKIDPYTRRNLDTTGNSIVSSNGSTYNWQATSWQTPDKQAMFLYELHVGTFSGNGDGVANYPSRYRDVVDSHLADLKALNVNMVEILPIHEFPLTSWGYNPVHFFAPESGYGTPDDLRYMVDTLHRNGIGVIIDVVYNHTSSSDNNLWDFDGPNNVFFFGTNCAGQTDYGYTRPKYTDSKVRQMVTDNVRYWMEEFRLDGVRVDLTSAMRNYCGEAGEGWLLMGDITDAARAVNPRAIVIAEEWPNNGSVTTSRGSGGAGFDAQWCDVFNDNLRLEVAKYNTGGSPDMNSVAYAIANPGWTGGLNRQAVKYVESHDEAGNDVRIVKKIDSTDGGSVRAKKMARVLGALTLLSPGIPMFLQGQEFLEDKQFGDAQAKRIWWGFLGANGGTRTFLGLAAGLRTARGSLRSDSGVQVTHTNDTGDVVAFQRYDLSGDVTFVVANFSATNFTAYSVGVPGTGTWHEVLNSDRSEYGGSGVVNTAAVASAPGQDSLPAKITIKLPPYSVLAFSQTNVPAKLSGWMVE